MAAVKQTVEAVEALESYEHGFVTDIDQEFAPKGLSADTVRFISAKKNEPEWMLEWRLKAYRHWLTMEDPQAWAKVNAAYAEARAALEPATEAFTDEPADEAFAAE